MSPQANSLIMPTIDWGPTFQPAYRPVPPCCRRTTVKLLLRPATSAPARPMGNPLIAHGSSSQRQPSGFSLVSPSSFTDQTIANTSRPPAMSMARPINRPQAWGSNRSTKAVPMQITPELSSAPAHHQS